MKSLIFLLAGLVVVGCTFETPSQKPALSSNKASVKGEVRQLLFRIWPNRSECQAGVSGPQQCLVVNGDLFYDTIDGYRHEAGKGRLIRVERTQICNPAIPNDCRQDAGIFRYRLLETLE